MPSPEPSRRHKTDIPPLSLREIRFCQHYAEHGDASAAYRAAGYPERPPRSTWVLAWRVLRNVKVREQIRLLRQQAIDAAMVSVQMVAQALKRIVDADRRKLYDAHGRILPPGQWPDDVAAIVEDIETEELFELVAQDRGKGLRRELVGHTRKVKTARRIDALRILAQWLRMTGEDKAAQGKTGNDPLVIGGEADPDVL